MNERGQMLYIKKGNHAIQAEITIAQHPEWNEHRRSIERTTARYKDGQQYIKDNKAKITTISSEDFNVNRTRYVANNIDYTSGWEPVNIAWRHGGYVEWN